MNRHDADILRALAEEKARIAALPAQRVHAELWQQANDLVPGGTDHEGRQHRAL
jgi:hypothetical protein